MWGGAASRAVIVLGLVAIGAACAETSPATIEPPTIELVGISTEVRIGTSIEYEFADGGRRVVDPAGRRVVTPHAWSGELVILGTDATGPFVATFMPQDGLPNDCYVENEIGIDRGDHVEARGILWRKAPGFAPATAIGAGDTYPSGTRFCFTDDGMIGSTVAP